MIIKRKMENIFYIIIEMQAYKVSTYDYKFSNIALFLTLEK